jgi:uncharacterized Fe-S cluster-containing radical SAM superfamily protein
MDFDAVGRIALCNHSYTYVAEMSDELSVLDVWRGAIYQRYRDEMRAYIMDERNCRHCVRQCSAGSSAHVFAVEQFDAWANDESMPLYPKRLIFRLNNTCNLGCVMCDGETSSRIRRERDHQPLRPSRYGERFFKDMEEILPHVEHVEFYGGEPFLVREHIRIFEIIAKTQSRCTIYANTNTVSLHPRAKEFLETLNFKTIAVSMDAVDPVLHNEIRLGLRSDLFLQNVDYLLDLRARRGVYVMLNVTEHRKNWFALPEVFRFAEARSLYLHINCCIHPHNVTLYTLPADQLRYVLVFLEEQRKELLRTYPHLSNLPSYDHLLSLVRDELESRRPGWAPEMSQLNMASDGLLAAPRPGVAPFLTPDSLIRESERIVALLEKDTALRMLKEMVARAQALPASSSWQPAISQIARAIGNLGPAKSAE